ncbi:MAG: ATP-dependent RecD-like DNA helicase [Prochlorococcus sp.]|nr:AAA family ATPase [Prochlorococcaceae cyanobacterium Fu_MAG_50]
MKTAEREHWPQGLTAALHRTLMRRVPSRQASTHLEDLVHVLMEALGRGELQLDLTTTPVQPGLKASGWPEAHRQALLASGWLEGEHSPMLLDGDQLSWRRWQTSMDAVVQALLHRSSHQPIDGELVVESTAMAPPADLNAEQQAAVNAIKHQGVILVSGGPGTGKTSTVVQMLVQAFSLNPERRIGLAAPTGKAARRLQDSVQSGLKGLAANHRKLVTTVPCNTLHRWLKAKPGGFAVDGQQPLPLDLLIVDEMSMVDLALMQALIEALPKRCQLVLVGDPAQLPPIGSGAVWHRLQQDEIRQQFAGGAIHLQRTYRNRGALATMNATLRQHGLNSFWKDLDRLSGDSNLIHHSCRINRLPEVLVERLQCHLSQLRQLSLTGMDETSDGFETHAETMMASLNQLMVLCPRRRGLWSVNDVHRSILGRQLDSGVGQWPMGLPVICGENQPELGVANGDIGLIIGEGNSRRLLFRVMSDQGELRALLLHPARLRTVDPALAITIHKAQGSEADQVILLWPQSPDLQAAQPPIETTGSYESRLLYTAITRARDQLDLITPIGLKAAIECC